MPTSLIDADSMLAIDVGSVTTRAMLFDVVEGRYRFIAAGAAATTAGAPFCDVGEGVRSAIDQLQNITGRIFLDKDEHLIIPSQPNGMGVDTCAATVSVGKPLKVVALGLLEDISAESAKRLATTTYARVEECLSLNDGRRTIARMDAILKTRPDLVIAAGGTDGGASQSVLSLLDAVNRAAALMPEKQRPEVLYVGNQALVDAVEQKLPSVPRLTTAPNVRPALDVEQLSTAQKRLANVFRTIRSRNLAGIYELDTWTGENLLPTATAFGRVIRFLSKVYDPVKGVLGVDIGSSAVNIAASFSGDLYTGVYPDIGLGENLDGVLAYSHPADILRWMPFEIEEDELRDFIHNKKLYPGSLPVTPEQLWLEQALARQLLSIAVRKLSPSFPRYAVRSSPSLLPWFEPIIATGSVLTYAPTRGQSLLMLLDGLQPVGVSTLVLDQNNILPALGAAASINSLLPIQVLESSTLLNLGTVISVTGSIQLGAPAVKVRVTFGDGSESVVDVKSGSLEVIPLPMGQNANLQLHPLNRADVGLGGAGRGGSVRVTGGALGVIIDARGRPLRLPKDPNRRRDLHKKWIWSLGG
jgi:hypothetical protein